MVYNRFRNGVEHMSGTNLNRIKNKRMQKNNTSGVTGVSFHSRKGQWYARISFKGKSHSLGYFDKLQDAIDARKEAETKLFDQFVSQTNKKKVIEV